MVLTTQTDPFHYNHTTSILHNTHIIMFHGFSNSNNSTYDNISAISWQSDLLMKDTRVPTENAIKLQEVTWPCVGVSE